MTYMNDRQRKEQIVIALFFKWIIMNGVEERDPEGMKAQFAIDDHVKLLIGGLSRGKVRKILEDSKRVHQSLMDLVFHPGGIVAKPGIALYYVVRDLKDCGAYKLDESTAYAQQIEFMLQGLSEIVNREPDVDRSAQRQAVRIFTVMQGHGLFPNVQYSAAA